MNDSDDHDVLPVCVRKGKPSTVSSLPLVLFLAVLVLIAFPVSADNYAGGLPLTTVQSGTVSGDLWFNATPPEFATSVTKDFTLPEAAVGSNVQWARLYVSTYNGHMQDQRHGNITIRWDNDRDGSYENVWTEDLNVPFVYVVDGGNDNREQGGNSGDPYKIVNNHCNRVTSDYFMWYDVKSLLTTRNIRVNAVASAIGSSFDGRIKIVTLVVAYNDGDSDQVKYWVNQGHDSCSYYTEDNFDEVAVSSTTFGTTGMSGISSATLTAAYMASSNGYYGFPTTANNFDATSKTGGFTNVNLDRTPDVQGSYVGVRSWNVTSSVSGSSTTLGYTRYLQGTGTAGFFKIPLAFLKVRYGNALPEPPVADFTAKPLTGITPLTVIFTDQSASTVTSRSWDFDNDGTTDSIAQNPTHTYTTPGTYTVNMTVTGPGGADSEIKTGYITVTSAPPVAAFIATPKSGRPPLAVLLNDTSTGGITSYAWDFTSDGTVDSATRNTTFTYPTSGTYTVNLTVSGPAGSSSAFDTITVSETAINETAIRPDANFTADQTRGSVPFTVKFDDKSVGTVTSWAWDFNNDGSIDSGEQNPSYIYSEIGAYTVTLTVTGPAGSDAERKIDYINVRGTPDCDLVIGGAINPIASTVFAREPNAIRVFNVKNNGPGTSPATTIELNASDGFTGRAAVPSLTSGGNATISIIDTTVRSGAGQAIRYNVTIDPDDDIAETDETNNFKLSAEKTVIYNGYKGKRYWDGGDITTSKTFNLNGGLVRSFGDSVYRSGSFGGSGWTTNTMTWSPDDLPIPANATIKQAILYAPYTWDNTNEIETISLNFNGESKTRGSWYKDKSNFGSYAEYVYGLVTYDVTSSFKKNSQNTAVFSRGSSEAKLSMYGCTLAVVYEDADSSRKQIFINEGFDLLGADESGYATTPEEATAYVPFSGLTIDPATVSHADLTTFVASGDTEGTLLFNDASIGSSVWDYGSSSGPQVAVVTRDVSNNLAKTGNIAKIQSTPGEMPAMGALQQFLIVEYGSVTVNRTSAVLVADFSAEPLNGTAPLTVYFTDLSTGNPISWAWDFDDDGLTDNATQYPQYVYQKSGNFTVRLTVKNATASHAVNRTGYILVTNATILSNVTALPAEIVTASTSSPDLRAPPYQDTGTISDTRPVVTSDITPDSQGYVDVFGAIIGVIKGVVDQIAGGLGTLRDHLPYFGGGGQGT
jgi:PKD repeat protein